MWWSKNSFCGAIRYSANDAQPGTPPDGFAAPAEPRLSLSVRRLDGGFGARGQRKPQKGGLENETNKLV